MEEEEKSPAPGRIWTLDLKITRWVVYHCATTVAQRFSYVRVVWSKPELIVARSWRLLTHNQPRGKRNRIYWSKGPCIKHFKLRSSFISNLFSYSSFLGLIVFVTDTRVGFHEVLVCYIESRAIYLSSNFVLATDIMSRLSKTIMFGWQV